MTDYTHTCQRLFDRYLAEGRTHPAAAVVATTARGEARCTVPDFAERYGLEVAEVEACEAGEVPFGDLPAVMGDIVEASNKVSMLWLAGLDRTVAEANRQAHQIDRPAER